MIREGWENWRMGVQLLGKYLTHVHVKNCGWFPKEKRADGTTVWGRPWVPMWEGMADWKEIIAALKSGGYDKWLSFEDFAQLPTEQKLKENLQYIKRLEAELEAVPQAV
jgi:sugar phosphate isomerase/epimerase